MHVTIYPMGVCDKYRRPMRTAVVVSIAVIVPVLTACSDEPLTDPKTPTVTTSAATARTPSAPESSPAAALRPFDADRAMRTVRGLADGIGPRLATSPAFRAAIAWISPHLVRSGYDVHRQGFQVPAGDSWGVPVEAGRSYNVVATPSGFDPSRPYLVVGAHLDTVAVAPGAEDNASGVSVLLELARTLGPTRLPTVLVAFGAEEPRGPGDLHHFGSRHYVAQMTAEERRNLRAMVALDRVGVGDAVPLSSVEGTATRVRDDLAAAARGLGIPTVVETDSASDHESFADAGFDAARVGSTPYAGYHSAGDVPSVVRPAQLARVGRLLTAWLRGR